jgi:hypothetical protein
VKTRQLADPLECNAPVANSCSSLGGRPIDSSAGSRHHKGIKRTGSSPLPTPIPISTFFAMLGWDDIETAAKTPITAAVMIMRT